MEKKKIQPRLLLYDWNLYVLSEEVKRSFVHLHCTRLHGMTPIKMSPHIQNPNAKEEEEEWNV